MNDAGPSSSRTTDHDAPGDAQEEAAVLTPAQMKERQKINRQTFNRKRALFLDDLLNSLDYLVYAELSAIYHMDCSFLRFAIRALIQFVLLTPKNDSYPRPPEPQPYVGAIIGTNLLCLFLHTWLSVPTGSEAARGYLQGGLAMDFIGQKGPSSKIHLVLLDLLLVVLQLVHLSAHVARNRLRDTSTKTPSSTAVATAAPTTQDLDSEERGVRRSDDLAAAQRDIELQPLTRAGTASPPDSSSSPPEPSSSDSNFSPSPDALIFDAFYSGQIVLGDFDLWRTLKEQFWIYQNASPEARGGTYRAQLAGRLMGIRVATGALGMRG